MRLGPHFPSQSRFWVEAGFFGVSPYPRRSTSVAHTEVLRRGYGDRDMKLQCLLL